MEALVAVGLASNILQFITFAGQILGKAKEISLSGTGLTDDAIHSGHITERLRTLCADLDVSQHSNADHRTAVEQLAQACIKVAEELQQAFAKIRGKPKQTKWKSLRAALKSVWTKGHIDTLQNRLRDYREQLMLEIVSMHKQEIQAAGKISQLYPILDAHSVQLRFALQDMSDRLSSSLGLLQTQMEQMTSQRSSLAATEQLQHFTAVLRDLTSARTNLEGNIWVLDSLQFSHMTDRFHKVVEACRGTYEHVYDKKGDLAKWTAWLSSNQRLFWISGKPGSGKSTLMKFLFENPQTTRLLKAWSGCRKLITTQHFFWINGNATARSQEGLFRSMWFEIFQQCPELVVQSRLDKQLKKRAFVGDPYLPEDLLTAKNLARLFGMVASQTEDSHCFVVFVDGLDEYDGSHRELVESLKTLSAFNNVKVCLASRPWNVFENAFGSDFTEKFYMQNFNRRDIAQYVQKTLQERHDYQRIQGKITTGDDLGKEVVEKSAGVFLWVYLVVRSLIDGLENADTMPALLRRLRGFPTDLNAFFTHMLRSLDPVYNKSVAQGFQLMLEADNWRHPPSLAKFWCMDNEDEQSGYITRCISGKQADWSLRLDAEAAQHFKTRINGRFKGLLEVHLPPKPPSSKTTALATWLKVDYLHRTVKDFLQTSDARAIVSPWMPAEARWHELQCKSSVAELFATINPDNSYWVHDEWSEVIRSMIAQIMFHAREYEIVTSRPLIDAMKLLDWICETPDARTRELSTDRCFAIQVRWGMSNLCKWRVEVSNAHFESRHLLEAISTDDHQVVFKDAAQINARIETLQQILDQQDWTLDAYEPQLQSLLSGRHINCGKMQKHLAYSILTVLCRHAAIPMEDFVSFRVGLTSWLHSSEVQQLEDELQGAFVRRSRYGMKRPCIDEERASKRRRHQ